MRQDSSVPGDVVPDNAPRHHGDPSDPSDSTNGHHVKKHRSRGGRKHKRHGAAPATCDEVIDTSEAHAQKLLDSISGGDMSNHGRSVETDSSATPGLDNPMKPTREGHAELQPDQSKGSASMGSTLTPLPPTETRSPATHTSTLVRRGMHTVASPPTTPDIAVPDQPQLLQGYEETRDSISRISGERKENASSFVSRAPASIEPPVSNRSFLGYIETKQSKEQNAASLKTKTVEEDDLEVGQHLAQTSAADETKSPPETLASPGDATPSGIGPPVQQCGGQSFQRLLDPAHAYQQAVSISQYDVVNNQRLVLLPETKVGLVLGKKGAHAAYFQHHSGASISVARDPGELGFINSVNVGNTRVSMHAPQSTWELHPDCGGGATSGVPTVTGGVPTDGVPGNKSESLRASLSADASCYSVPLATPAVDSNNRRRIHVIGTDGSTWACACMIKRLVETSSFRADKTISIRRQFSDGEQNETGNESLKNFQLASPPFCAPPVVLSCQSNFPYGDFHDFVVPPIGFADDDLGVMFVTDRDERGVSNASQVSTEAYENIQISKDANSLQMRVPEKRVGLIIGRKGENIRFLQNITRAHIQVQPPEFDRTGVNSLLTQDHSGTRLVLISGASDAIAEAKLAVDDLCAGKLRVGSQRVIPPQPSTNAWTQYNDEFADEIERCNAQKELVHTNQWYGAMLGSDGAAYSGRDEFVSYGASAGAPPTCPYGTGNFDIYGGYPGGGMCPGVYGYNAYAGYSPYGYHYPEQWYPEAYGVGSPVSSCTYGYSPAAYQLASPAPCAFQTTQGADYFPSPGEIYGSDNDIHSLEVTQSGVAPRVLMPDLESLESLSTLCAARANQADKGTRKHSPSRRSRRGGQGKRRCGETPPSTDHTTRIDSREDDGLD